MDNFNLNALYKSDINGFFSPRSCTRLVRIEDQSEKPILKAFEIRTNTNHLETKFLFELQLIITQNV